MRPADEPDLKELLAIAGQEVLRWVSPSARSNVADHIAADAVQEYLEDRHPEVVRNPGAHVRVIARRRAIDAMRRWGRRLERQPALETVAEAEPDELYFAELARWFRQSLSPSAALLQKEEREWVDEFLAQELDWPDLTIMRRALEGQPPRDIAVELGLTPKTVSNRLTGIRARLRAELAERSPAD